MSKDEHPNSRSQAEIAHGKWLAENCPESIWGWDSPAGKKRFVRRVKYITDGARLGTGKKALEIGCGTGMFTEQFASCGCKVVAVDISPDLIEKARERKLNPDQVRFEISRFESFKGNERFDAVIGSSVLHHLEIEDALSNIFELLLPGGWMSFAEPNYLNPQVFLERRFRQFFPYVSNDETAFVRFSLAKLMKQVGFTDIRLVPFDWLHPSVPKPLIPLVSGIGLMFEKTPGIREFSGSLLIQGKRPE